MTRPQPTDGDCWAECLAHLFRVPFNEVAHLSCRTSPDDWIEKTEAWLRERGLFPLQVERTGNRWPFAQPADGIKAIATGPRDSDGAPHAAVVRIRSDPERLHIRTVFCPNGGLREVAALVFFAKRFDG